MWILSAHRQVDYELQRVEARCFKSAKQPNKALWPAALLPLSQGLGISLFRNGLESPDLQGTALWTPISHRSRTDVARGTHYRS